MVNPVSHENNPRVCDYCQSEFRAGELFCEVCGNSQYQTFKTKPTRPPLFNELLQSERSNETFLAEDQPLFLHIIDVDMTMIVQPQERIVLGRSVLLGSNSQSVDIDLVPFDAFSKGVSQVHAVILREENGVFLIDQGSKNGTRVNGVELEAEQPYQIQNGDIVYLSKMPIRFGFPQD